MRSHSGLLGFARIAPLSMLLFCALAIFAFQASAAKRTRADEIDREFARAVLTKHVDKFTGSVSVAVEGKIAGRKADDVAGAWEVFVTPFYIPPGIGGFYLMFGAILKDWAFLDGSIDLIADGKPGRLRSVGDISRDVRSGGSVQESFLVRFQLSELDSLAQASQIEFRLNGSHHSVTGSFSARQIAQMRAILQAPAFLGHGAMGGY